MWIRIFFPQWLFCTQNLNPHPNQFTLLGGEGVVGHLVPVQ
jgi:hypothetical protein